MCVIIFKAYPTTYISHLLKSNRPQQLQVLLRSRVWLWSLVFGSHRLLHWPLGSAINFSSTTISATLCHHIASKSWMIVVIMRICLKMKMLDENAPKRFYTSRLNIAKDKTMRSQPSSISTYPNAAQQLQCSPVLLWFCGHQSIYNCTHHN